MTEWIDEQTDSLRLWIRRMKAPLLVSKADGTILYANEAFESFLGYSVAELLRVSWKELTVSDADLEADLAMVRSVQEGTRMEYEQQKSYRHKRGHPKECFIHVLRYPLLGPEIDCFLVTVRPLDGNQDYIARQLENFRLAQLEQVEMLAEVIEEKRRSSFERAWQWATENKLVAGAAGLFFSTFLFGDRALEHAANIKKLFFP